MAGLAVASCIALAARTASNPKENCMMRDVVVEIVSER
jgi:hypothetical protein